MKRFSCFFIWIFVLTSILPAQESEVKLKVVQTSDIHGNYYPYDFIRRRRQPAVWHVCMLWCKRNVRFMAKT